MSNSFVELALQSGGDKLDMELLTISSQNVKRQRGQITGSLELEVARVHNGVLPSDQYGLGVREIVGRATVASVFSAQVLNATPFATSSAINTEDHRICNFFVSLSRSGAPTGTFKIIPQFSDDGGTDWFEARDYVLQFADTVEFDSGLNLAYQIPILAPDMRFRIEATGTDGTNTITVTMTQELTT